MRYVRVTLVMAGMMIMATSVDPVAAQHETVSPDEVKRYFEDSGMVVVTFLGYSGSGYEDPQQMLAEAKEVLSVHSPQRTIVNIGATQEGIGAVYDLAREMKFRITGIVSTQAQKYDAATHPHLERTFFIADETWGGFVEGTEQLSPTSQAMVECSDVLVAIGGGAVARDELIAGKRLGKTVKFIAADMNHQKAIEKARAKGRPEPDDFAGEAHRVFGTPRDEP